MVPPCSPHCVLLISPGCLPVRAIRAGARAPPWGSQLLAQDGHQLWAYSIFGINLLNNHWIRRYFVVVFKRFNPLSKAPTAAVNTLNNPYASASLDVRRGVTEAGPGRSARREPRRPTSQNPGSGGRSRPRPPPPRGAGRPPGPASARPLGPLLRRPARQAPPAMVNLGLSRVDDAVAAKHPVRRAARKAGADLRSGSEWGGRLGGGVPVREDG